MTEPEIILWSRLKLLKARGFHIRRQAPFRGYVLDFVCLERRLVVELDGSQHGEDDQEDHDFVRDHVLKREGFRVLRFWNSAVRLRLGEVMHAIVLALEAGPPLPHPSPPPADPPSPRGGGKIG